ncbi:hypothetical protein V2J09_020310 [Rumex salicifolius]
MVPATGSMPMRADRRREEEAAIPRARPKASFPPRLCPATANRLVTSAVRFGGRIFSRTPVASQKVMAAAAFMSPTCNTYLGSDDNEAIRSDVFDKVRVERVGQHVSMKQHHHPELRRLFRLHARVRYHHQLWRFGDVRCWFADGGHRVTAVLENIPGHRTQWLHSRVEINGYEEYSGTDYRSAGCTEEYTVIRRDLEQAGEEECLKLEGDIGGGLFFERQISIQKDKVRIESAICCKKCW